MKWQNYLPLMTFILILPTELDNAKFSHLCSLNVVFFGSVKLEK